MHSNSYPDDGSSWFYDENNVLVWGAHKWRDGVNKSYVSNLYVVPPGAAQSQQWGIGYYTANTAFSRFSGNTMVAFNQTKHQFAYVWAYGKTPMPNKAAGFAVENNHYFTPGSTSMPFAVAGDPKDVHSGGSCKISSLAQWQQCCDCEKGSTVSHEISEAEILAMAEGYLQLP